MRLIRQGAGPRCAICRRQLMQSDIPALTAEHLRPLRAGGTSALANLAPAHARCNFGWRRGARP